MREDCTAVGRSWREGSFRKFDHTRMPGKKVSSVLHNCTTDSLTLAFLWGTTFRFTSLHHVLRHNLHIFLGHDWSWTF